MSRSTRLGNGLPKKVANVAHAVSLQYVQYNFGRPRQSPRGDKDREVTPAMAAGVSDHPWSLTKITGLLD